MSNLHRPRFQKYNARILGHLLENQESIDRSQLSHLLAIQENTFGLNEFRTTFDFKLDKKDKDCAIAKLGYGRIYGEIGAGAYLDNNYRHNLYANYYHDIDMSNCHPNLLIQVAKKKEIEMLNLQKYVDHREEYIKEVIEYYGQHDIVKVRRDIKTEIIATLYGAEIPTFKCLRAELNVLTDALKEEHSTLYQIVKDRNRKNTNGAFLAYLAQTYERQCLDAMDSYYLNMNRQVDDLAYDGLMVRKLNPDEIFPQELLNGAEKFIFEKTGFNMKLEIKPMIQTIDPSKLESKIDKQKKQYASMKKDFEKNNAYYSINNSIIHIGHNSKMQIKTIEHIREEYGHLTVIIDGKKKQFVDVWRKDENRRIIHSLVYKMPDDLLPGEFSLFQGFDYLKYDSDEKMYEDHIRVFEDLISAQCADEVPCKDHVLKTFAHMLQYPFIKNGIVTIFASPIEGTGKDTLMLIIKNIIGNAHTAHYTNTETFWDKHNTGMEGAILVYLEEACSNLNKQNEGALKAVITSDTLMMNPKGIKPYTVPNIGRFIQTTNEADSANTKQGSRRNNLLSPCDRLKKRDWVSFYRDYVHNKSFIRNIGDYLMSIDLTGWNPSDFPESEYRKELIDTVVSSEVLFLNSWNPSTWIKSAEIYQEYKSFCIEQSLFYCHSTISFCKKLISHKNLFVSAVDTTKQKYYYKLKKDEDATKSFNKYIEKILPLPKVPPQIPTSGNI